MNDDVAATVIEALAMRVRSLEGEILGVRLDGAAMIAALRKQVDALSVVDAEYPPHGGARTTALREARQLATEVLARDDVNGATRRRAERIVNITNNEGIK